ncbi:MAG: hypothetical protein AB6733_04585 [Clostridiaceae bacterium]
MSYDLHITKAENWWESDKRPITKEEILSLVNSEIGFRLENEVEIRNPISGEEIFILGEFIVWEKEGNELLFDYTEGRITGGAHCNEDIEKLKYIAERLNAKVQGDDGEIY